MVWDESLTLSINARRESTCITHRWLRACWHVHPGRESSRLRWQRTPRWHASAPWPHPPGPGARASSGPTTPSPTDLPVPCPQCRGPTRGSPGTGWDISGRDVRFALGAMPMLPEIAAPRSVRMSPNRFDATTISSGRHWPHSSAWSPTRSPETTASAVFAYPERSCLPLMTPGTGIPHTPAGSGQICARQ